MGTFIQRTKELKKLRGFLTNPNARAALVYGVRRIGKTALIQECIKTYPGTVINFFSLLAPLADNIEALSRQVFETLHFEGLKTDSLEFIFDFLGKQAGTDFLFVIDEYQYMKLGEKSISVDSLMQKIIDTKLSGNIKLIVTGSYISIMKELLSENNPLFGRFDVHLHLKEMDYYDSSLFYAHATPREKIEFYAVFGGSPNASRLINPGHSLKQNIITLLLDSDAILRSHVEHDLLQDFGKVEDLVRILSALGNGKKRYSEIADRLGYAKPSYIDRPLRLLLDIGVVRKVYPINKKHDAKKVFYEISNNLVRFYYAYIYGNFEGELSFMGPELFYEKRIAPSITTYISFRFEAIAQEFFSRAIQHGWLHSDVVEIGTYWYDDKQAKTNGEFDVAMRSSNGQYAIAEVKFLKSKMSPHLMQQEREKIHRIPELNCPQVFFVSASGFETSSVDEQCISGDDLYCQALDSPGDDQPSHQ